jgi:glutathionylspermidine synthase
VRESAIFECFKWDPQVEDVSVLAPFALTISRETWEALSSLAEQLARETIAAEMSLLQHEGLHRKMGFSRAIRKALRSAAASPAVAATRFMRFDFHYTSDGWRISEVNSDVPGGMNEASGFTKLMAAELSGTICGDPARELARAAVAGREGNGPVGLIHATAYSDDRQVMEYLARELSQLGVRTVQLSPSHVVWRERRAWTQSGEELSAMLRFFPAEWLDELSSNSGWQQFFCAKTPSVNPGPGIAFTMQAVAALLGRTWHARAGVAKAAAANRRSARRGLAA